MNTSCSATESPYFGTDPLPLSVSKYLQRIQFDSDFSPSAFFVALLQRRRDKDENLIITLHNFQRICLVVAMMIATKYFDDQNISNPAVGRDW